MRFKYDFKSIIENFIEKILNFFLLSIKKKSKIDLKIQKFENNPDNIKLKKLKNLQLEYKSNPIPTLKIAEILFKRNDLNWINTSKNYLEKIKNWKKKINNKKYDNYHSLASLYLDIWKFLGYKKNDLMKHFGIKKKFVF